ncbi:MAG: 3-hydroxyacyl-CoA dehydrogenase [Pseudomonadota bacterium]
MATQTSLPSVALIGTGIIGQSWSICFARAGHQVRMFDHLEGAAKAALPSIRQMLASLEHRDLLQGQTLHTILQRISVADDLTAALDGAGYVQESTPEKIDIKRGIFAELDAHAAPDAIIASSTSALLPSQFTEGLPGGHRCLVAHPLNPPHLIPAVEVVPSPQTAPACVMGTVELLASIGQEPVIARKEVAGFIMNRLQGALLDEAFALVRDGVASIEDIDTAMRDGLARRWSFMGPFETIDLNAPGGVSAFLQRYQDAYDEIGKGRPDRPAWNGTLADEIIAACRSVRPLDTLDDRQAWRNEQLAALSAFKQHNGKA